MGLRRRVPGTRAIALAAAMVVLALALPAGAGAATQAGPAPAPGISPPGANDWSCRPTARRPVPVILVHGTFGDMTVSWNALSPLLKADGFCVFALDYGNRATAPMEQSADAARRLRAAGAVGDRRRQGVVRRPLPGRLAGAAGRALPRPAEPDGGRRRPGAVEPRDDEPARAPGGRALLPGLPRPARGLGRDAAPQRAAGGAVGRRLDRGLDALRRGRAAVHVTGPLGSTVTNVVLQDRCRLDLTDHLGIIYDAAALQWTRDALRRDGPADPAFRPACV